MGWQWIEGNKDVPDYIERCCSCVAERFVRLQSAFIREHRPFLTCYSLFKV